MIAAVCVFLICASALFAQWRHQEHEFSMSAGHSRLDKVEERLALVERRHFDPVAFEDIKTKVESLRLAQGMRR